MTAEEPNDQAVEFLIDNLCREGYEPETIDFLIAHPEYEHRPVGVREFITSEKYLNAKSDCWPAILEDLEEIFDQPVDSLKLSSYLEIIRKMGYGSGKGYRLVFMFCYVAYRLGCFKDPQRAYGLAQGSEIALVNAAITAPHAKKIIFGAIKERIRNSPWFCAHMQPDPNIQSELRFPKNIVIFPGSSSEVAPVGYNIFLFNVDEAAFFPDTDARDAAQTIYDTGRKRIKSRFGENGLAAAISSPSYVDNFIERKCEEAKTDPKISAKEGPTWENKPADIEQIKRGEYFELKHPRTRQLTKIPNVYKDDFKKNPQSSWRDYGGVASMALEPYFSEEELARLEAIIARGQVVLSHNDVVHVPGALYHGRIDFGLTRDACGLAIGHEDGGKVKIDLVLRIVCRRRAEQLERKGQKYDMIIGEDQVIFEQVREIIFDLMRRGFSFGMMSFDQFQSVDSRQQFEKVGVPAALVSVDRDTAGYDTLKSLINTECFEMVQHEHALKEAGTLELKNGKKVDHAPGSSKDLMDAIAGICLTILEGYDEEDEHEETYVEDGEDEQIEVTPQI